MLSVKNTSVFFRFFALPFIPFFVVCILLSFFLFSFSVFSYNTQTAEAVPEEIKLAHKSIWEISWSDSGITLSGTGFFVGENHFITNFHVIYPMLKNIEHITLSQKGNPTDLKVINILALSAIHDLVLVEVKTKHFTNFLSLRESQPEPYEDLYVPAYLDHFVNIKKTGNIFFHGTSHLFFAVNHSSLYGTSGSPVLDKQGQVVGVSFAAIHNTLFALSMGDLKEFIIGNTGSNCAHFINLTSCAEKEIENLKTLAPADSVEVQHQLALMYYNGRRIEKDLDKAFQWMSKAAKQAYAPAQYQLAMMYYNAEGTEKNWDKAFQWMSKTAKQAYAPAQYQLAMMYYNAEGTEKDWNKAFQWMSKAAEQVYAPAQHGLALMYYNAEGTEKNWDKAFQWLSKAAELDYAPAQHQLVLMYYNGEGTEKNWDKAFQWMSKAVEQAYAPAQHGLALMYFYGEGTEKNWDKAFQWMSKAAELDYAPAQYGLALMYFYGEGTEKNWDKAFQWMSKAVEQAYAPAQQGLALIGNK